MTAPEVYGDRPDAVSLVVGDDEVMLAVYGMTEWLAHTWTVSVDERIDALVLDAYDLADRVARLCRLVIAALVLTAAVAAVGVVVLVR